jgi:tRNA G18 (ribose-2'-O)-methylase SpoU
MHKIALIVDNIRSTHNVGAILRTAECLGASKVYLCGTTPYPKHKADTRLPHIAEKTHNKIHKTALGAEAMVPWEYAAHTSDAIAAARAEGYHVIALEQDDTSVPLASFKAALPLAIVVGPEVAGIDKQTLALCDYIVEIPMSGEKESLNVSIAAAIALYHFTR